MDLLNRRTSAASRRGTLLPGGARRNGISTAQAAAPAASTGTAKTALLDEFRAHEEDVAARVLQRAARAFLSRRFVAKLLLKVYRRQYDPIEKHYYYINTETNETTWDRPLALQMFLSDAQDVPVARGNSGDETGLPVGEASRRIQRVARAFLAKRLMQRLVRENYMKLFDASSKTFYYLNTRTGDRSADKPLFLGKDDANDIPVETFQFRKAVCKVSSSSNLYGSGVLGFFGATASNRWLCLLSDAKTLPDAATASTAHVLCNFSPDGISVPFQVALRPESFFASLCVDAKAKGPPGVAHFAMCAVDKDAFFERAGTNVEPLRFEMNDRKMGCADATSGGVQPKAALEVVGHPHGKPRVVHTRTLHKMLPNSVAPLQMQLDREAESGSAGCAVFTRGGKLLGLLPFTPLKEPPPRACFYLRPILDAATALVTPPEPFLLTTCLASNEVTVCWSIVRWFKPLPGLSITYELELSRPEPGSSKKTTYDTFSCVYQGSRKSKHVGGLESDRVYSLRVRACNPMVKGAWSHVLTFRTMPTPSLAWRIPRYCTSVSDACKRMTQQREDVAAQLQGVQWIARHLEQHGESETALQDAEVAFLDAYGLDWVLETITTRFPNHHTLVLLTLRVLTTLTRLERRTQRLLSQVLKMQTIMDLFERHLPAVQTETERIPTPTLQVANRTPVETEQDVVDLMAIPLTCVELLGAVLDGDNPSSAQQTAQALGLAPLLLAVLARDDNRLLKEHAPLVAEITFLLARYTHNHTHNGKWQLVERGRLAVLRDILLAYADSSASTVVYWTLITIGNVAYACPDEAREQLDGETQSLQLVGAVCHARAQFLVRIHELELAVGSAQREFTRLAASVMGDDMRNEMDAYEHEVLTLTRAIQELRDAGDVAQAGDFALRYLLTEEQRRVQRASQRILRKLLLRTSAAAFAKWQDATLFERQCGVFRRFETAVRLRQLSAAFRKWEVFVRAWRKHHKSVVVDAVLGAGLALDLNKRQRERYRLLALQK